MRKVFVDFGMHNGQTLIKAMGDFTDFDLFIGLEPVKSLYEAAVKKTKNNNKVKLFNAAIDNIPEKEKEIVFYEDTGRGNMQFGSSIMSDKKMKSNREIKATCLGVVPFFQGMFKEDDYIVLKLDIEGKEYDVLDGLIESGEISKVDKLYVEWHWRKVASISKERHQTLVKKLQKLGLDITGDRKKDEYYRGKA